MKFYVSGPITGHPDHREEFSTVAAMLVGKGHETLIPQDIPAFCDGDNCAPGIRNGEDDPHTWPCYLRADLVAMLACDAVFMMLGWSSSKGATFERFVATSCGMPVFYDHTI